VADIYKKFLPSSIDAVPPPNKTNGFQTQVWGPFFLFDRAGSGIDSASGTDAGDLREFGEHGSPPQNRVALASATLSDSPVP
jgi:hypothetical protein